MVNNKYIFLALFISQYMYCSDPKNPIQTAKQGYEQYRGDFFYEYRAAKKRFQKEWKAQWEILYGSGSWDRDCTYGREKRKRLDRKNRV